MLSTDDLSINTSCFMLSVLTINKLPSTTFSSAHFSHHVTTKHLGAFSDSICLALISLCISIRSTANIMNTVVNFGSVDIFLIYRSYIVVGRGLID